MNEEIGKSQVEIGWDEEEGDFYLEAGSEEAFYAFLGILLQTPEAVIAYVETHIVTYEEVEMQGKGLKTNRIELIHMITNIIDASQTRLIEDRDQAAALAIEIVDGLEDEAARRTPAEVAVSCKIDPVKCPGCGVVTAERRFSGVSDDFMIKCGECEHEAPLSEFRTADAGDGGEE